MGNVVLDESSAAVLQGINTLKKSSKNSSTFKLADKEKKERAHHDAAQDSWSDTEDSDSFGTDESMSEHYSDNEEDKLIE